MESIEYNIFTFVLVILIIITLYWLNLDHSEKAERRKAVIEKSIKEKREYNDTHNYDYGIQLAIFGFFMGGWMGYLFRPSIFGQQLPIEKILDFITNYQKCSPWLDDSLQTDYIYRQCQEWYFYKNPIATSMAYTSVEYIITGAILGVVIGWVVGKIIKR